MSYEKAVTYKMRHARAAHRAAKKEGSAKSLRAYARSAFNAGQCVGKLRKIAQGGK
jgi:hypothetical protein